jgi:hypothetical protein
MSQLGWRVKGPPDWPWGALAMDVGFPGRGALMDRLLTAAGILAVTVLLSVIRWWGLRTGTMPSSFVWIERDKYPRIFQAAS